MCSYFGFEPDKAWNRNIQLGKDIIISRISWDVPDMTDHELPAKQIFHLGDFEPSRF